VGQNFRLKNGVWTDSAFDPAKNLRVETIKFASPAYFALAKDALSLNGSASANEYSLWLVNAS
jgi:hypothetical protein